MFDRLLDEVGSSGGDNDGQQREPGNARLIKIADPEKGNDMREQRRAKEPEIPFLVAVAFDSGPSGVPVGLALPGWQNSLAVRSLEWLSFRAARIWKTMCAYQFIVRTRAEQINESD